MTVGALLAWGMPPTGLGVFARDDVEEGLAWKHVVVNLRRTDRAAQAEYARSIGATLWLSSDPDNWSRSAWPQTLELALERVAELGAVGFIAEYESDWPHASDEERREYGAALRAASFRTRVGVTYFPDIGGLEVLADACGLGVWGLVQMYGRSASDRDTFGRWWARTARAFGLRAALAIAGWRSSDRIDTEPEFRAYLSALPAASGAFVWPLGRSTIPAFMVDALRSYEPGGSFVGTAVQSVTRALLRPAAAVAAALLVGLALLVVAIARWARA